MNAEETLSSLLDEMIPPSPDRGMPGAGAVSLGLGPRIRAEVPDIAPLVDSALAALHAKALERGAESFAGLAAEDRTALVKQLADEQPMVIPALQFHLYCFYYAMPEVLEALGMPGRPPHPDGYEMEENELGLLEAVRAREKIYREA